MCDSGGDGGASGGAAGPDNSPDAIGQAAQGVPSAMGNNAPSVGPDTSADAIGQASQGAPNAMGGVVGPGPSPGGGGGVTAGNVAGKVAGLALGLVAPPVGMLNTALGLMGVPNVNSMVQSMVDTGMSPTGQTTTTEGPAPGAESGSGDGMMPGLLNSAPYRDPTQTPVSPGLLAAGVTPPQYAYQQNTWANNQLKIPGLLRIN